MMKNLLFAVAMLSLALASGCATGGNGIVPPPPTVTVAISSPTNVNPSAIYPTQSLALTATVANSTSTAVTWSLSGPGTLTPVTPPTTPATAAYVAPAAAGSATVTATLTSDTSIVGTLPLTVIPVSVVVTPLTVNVGQDLVQQFTAIAVPDDAPQTFTWSCTPTGSCGSLVPDASTSVAVYAAPASPFTGNVVIAATWNPPVPPTQPSVGQSKVSVAASRLPQGAYAFQFSGYDTNGNAVATAGSLTVGANGAITGGVEDVVINGVYNQYSPVTGSYSPSANNGNDISNNLGTLTLDASGGPTYIYTAVLTSSGIVRMIESDTTGITGSGILQKSAANTVFNAGAQTFAFGFTGVDSGGNRVGYVGLLPMTGGSITGGLIDSNDNSTTTTFCTTPPCTVTGTYTYNSTTNVGQMTLTAGSATLDFDFFVSAGTTPSKTQPNPLTIYAISTDPVDATHPAVSGSLVYWVPMTYNNAAFSGTSVSNLTGLNVTSGVAVANTSNVSLTVGTTDGTSGGNGGAGGFIGTFDQNNNGTIVSVPGTAPFSYTYVASSSNTGRYIFQMLGNPTVTPVVAPLPFVLYASGANRGFLLDESSAAVMTGTMNPQPTLNKFSYTPSELPGTYAAATVTSSTSTIEPVVQNLLLTSTGNATYNVAGIQNPGSLSLTGSYTIANNYTGGGTGTITLTSPPPPAVTNYVIYAIDANAITGTTNDVITDFMMMGLTSGTPSSIIFAQQ